MWRSIFALSMVCHTGIAMASVLGAENAKVGLSLRRCMKEFASDEQAAYVCDDGHGGWLHRIDGGAIAPATPPADGECHHYFGVPKQYGDEKLKEVCSGSVPVSCPQCKEVPSDKRTEIFNLKNDGCTSCN
mmetsp:Transcript_67258/g.161211  ORF Transcript_67258/g.161211 Transcript_67258/m.161211 type:complete len:131 (+) Transcript_67258:87-479(+)